MNHAFRSYSLSTFTYSLNRTGQAARSTRATARRRRYIGAAERLPQMAAASARRPYHASRHKALERDGALLIVASASQAANAPCNPKLFTIHCCLFVEPERASCPFY